MQNNIELKHSFTAPICHNTMDIGAAITLWLNQQGEAYTVDRHSLRVVSEQSLTTGQWHVDVTVKAREKTEAERFTECMEYFISTLCIFA